MKGSINENDYENDYCDNSNSNSRTNNSSLYTGSRSPTSPASAPRVVANPVVSATAAAAAAAAAAPKQEEGLSLYEELLRFHRENPDEEDLIKQQVPSEALDGEEDRKPAARPTQEQRKKNNGTYRVPVSREYFAAKDREGGFHSPGSTGNGKSKVPRNYSSQQLPTTNLADWDDARLLQGGSNHSTSLLSDIAKNEMPMPFADASFHDLAEDEAFARQLQAEEEERVAAAAAARRAASADAHVGMPPLSPMSTPSYRSSSSSDEAAALARQFAGLSTDNAPFLPSISTHQHASTGALPDLPRLSRNHKHFQSEGSHHTGGETIHSKNDQDDDEIAQQAKILQQIAEENERKQLERALEESKRMAELQSRHPREALRDGPGMADLSWQAPRSSSTNEGRHHYHHARSLDSKHDPDWEAEQRVALEIFQKQQREMLQRSARDNGTTNSSKSGEHFYHTTGHIDLPSQRGLQHSQNIQLQRHDLHNEILERGHRETANAIRSGQAHMIRCEACAERLQAPIHYSLVYCPKCGHVTPVK